MKTLTRRTALAAVPALAATPLLAVGASFPDDPYIRLYRRHETTYAAYDAAWVSQDEAEGRRFHPSAPGYVRSPSVNVFGRYHCTSVEGIREHCQPVRPDGPFVKERDRLIADLEAQQAEHQKARRAAGLTELDRAVERLHSQWRELREQISTAPANSLQGVLLKVRELDRAVTQGQAEWDDELARTTVADLERLVAGRSS